MNTSKKVFLVMTHPVVNVPPPLNSARELANHGYQVVVIGYHKSGLKSIEKIGNNAYILRLKLRSHSININFLRKLLSLIEFLFLSLKGIKKKCPDIVIIFNDPTTILFRFLSKEDKITKVNWLLEFPEFNRVGFIEKFLYQFSSFCWKFSDVMVLPTKERLALSLCLQPSCLEKMSYIIHNSPRSQALDKKIFQYSQNAKSAIEFFANEKAKGNITIVYAGAIGNRYAVDKLIHSIGQINCGISLLLLGKKHDLAIKEVNFALKKTGKSNNNIMWIDEIHYDELSKVLSYADIGFAIYIGDSLNTFFSAPGKIYEYLKAGLVILTDHKCCIASELLAYNCGIVIPQEEKKNYTLTSFISDEILGQQQRINNMKTQSRKLYENFFDFSRQVKPLLSYLDKQN